MAFTKRNVLLSNLGLDVSSPSEYIDPRNSPNGQNMYLNRNAIHKRVGTTAMGASLGEEVMALKELLQDSTRYVTRIGLSNIETYNQVTDVWTNINTYTIGAGNNKLNFSIGAGEITATIANASYQMGAVETDASTLCKAIYDAICAAEATGTYTVRYTAGKVTITRSAGTFSILWKTGTNGSTGTDTHIGTILGFSDAADSTGALSYTAAGTPVFLTGSTLDVISTATPILSGRRILVISNNFDAIKKYNPVVNPLVVDLGGSPPKAKFMQEFGGYLVLANVTDGGNRYQMRVQWSDTDAIETWTGGNSGARDLLEDGNDITGVSVYGNFLCIHKETAIYLGYLVSTSLVFDFERRNTGVGTICNATIQLLNTGEQVFLARDGIHAFNGNYAPLIESPIQDEIRESINPEYIHKCWSVVIPELDEYWVGIPIGSQTSPDTVYKFNYKTRQCYKDTRANVRACGKYQLTTDTTWDTDTSTWDSATDRWDDINLLAQHQAVMIGDSAGITCRRNSTVNNDNGVAINGFRDTKDFEAEDKGAMVRWLGMQIWAKGNTLDLLYSTDAGVTWTKVDTFTLSSDYPADDAPIWAYFDFVSTKARFRFQNNVSGETFSIKDFQIEMQQREFRR